MIVKRLQNDELYHHGIKGQKWGVRRYQNPDGTLNKRGQRKLKRLENTKERFKKSYKSYDNKGTKIAAYGLMGLSGALTGFGTAGTSLGGSTNKKKIATRLALGTAIGALASVPYTKATIAIGKKNNKMWQKYYDKKINELKNIGSMDDNGIVKKSKNKDQ